MRFMSPLKEKPSHVLTTHSAILMTTLAVFSLDGVFEFVKGVREDASVFWCSGGESIERGSKALLLPPNLVSTLGRRPPGGVLSFVGRWAVKEEVATTLGAVTFGPWFVWCVIDGNWRDPDLGLGAVVRLTGSNLLLREALPAPGYKEVEGVSIAAPRFADGSHLRLFKTPSGGVLAFFCLRSATLFFTSSMSFETDLGTGLPALSLVVLPRDGNDMICHKGGYRERYLFLLKTTPGAHSRHMDVEIIMIPDGRVSGSQGCRIHPIGGR